MTSSRRSCTACFQHDRYARASASCAKVAERARRGYPTWDRLDARRLKRTVSAPGWMSGLAHCPTGMRGVGSNVRSLQRAGARPPLLAARREGLPKMQTFRETDMGLVSRIAALQDKSSFKELHWDGSF